MLATSLQDGSLVSAFRPKGEARWDEEVGVEHGSERDKWGRHYWGHCKFHVV